MRNALGWTMMGWLGATAAGCGDDSTAAGATETDAATGSAASGDGASGVDGSSTAPDSGPSESGGPGDGSSTGDEAQPGQARLVYFASPSVPGASALKLVDSRGALPADPVRLGPAPVAAEIVTGPVYSPTEDFLVYRSIIEGEDDTLHLIDLRDTPPGDAAVVDTAPAPSGPAFDAVFAPDETRIAFFTPPSEGGGIWVSTLSDGAPGSPVLLTPEVPQMGFLGHPAVFSPEADRIAYAANLGDGPGRRLCLTPTDPARAGQCEQIGELDPAAIEAPVTFGPGGDVLVYAAQAQMHAVDLSGAVPGTPEALGAVPAFGETLEQIVVAPDRAWMAYWVGDDLQGVLSLVVLDAGDPQAIIVAGDDVIPSQVRVSSDGETLAYLAGDPALPQSFVVDVSSGSPGSPIPIQSGGRDDAGVTRQQFTPDGSAVLYVASGALWWVDLASGEPTEPVVVSAGSDVVDEAIVSADGSNIAFSAASGGGLPQLYLARRTEDTWAAPVQLNPALREGGQVHAGAQFSPDGRKVFFIASDGPEGLRRAFEIDLVRDEPGTAVLLSGEDAVGGLHVLPE